jgi:4-phytase/acid phosphatase
MQRELMAALVALAVAAPAGAQTVTDDETILRQIILFGRHSVRSPVAPPALYATLSPKPYPDFGVPTGYLTPHGQQAAALMGSYFRQYLLEEGLLTGDAETDLAKTYFRANSIQRSNVTATMFGQGLIPGVTIPVHSYALGHADAVFDPIGAGVVTVNAERAAKEARGIYNGGEALAAAFRSELALARATLFNYAVGTEPAPATPAGITDATAMAIPLTANATVTTAGTVVNLGGLVYTEATVDPFVMEYANGMPMSDVAWGRLSADGISQLTRLAALEQRINYRTPYVDQVQSSNAASHVLRSMRQAVLGMAEPGAWSGPEHRILVLISSDTFVTGLAGLLDAHWQLSGYQADFCAPGGALVFEVRQSKATAEFLVRVYYTAQSMDQLRNLTPLTLKNPPETAQLRIPGGSRPGAGFDVKFEVFQKLLEGAIGRRYVQAPSSETPPDVLSEVPLR